MNPTLLLIGTFGLSCIITALGCLAVAGIAFISDTFGWVYGAETVLLTVAVILVMGGSSE